MHINLPNKHNIQPLYLAIHFPMLAIECLKETLKPEQPIAVLYRHEKGLFTYALNDEARHSGLTTDMALTHARALCENLKTYIQDPKREQQFLERLALDTNRFTPLTAYCLPHGLMLNVSGCDHLFGGPKAMLIHLKQHYQKLGLNTKMALASNPMAARAFARFNKTQYVEPLNLAPNIDQLPLEALETLPHAISQLKRAGFAKLGDIKHLPTKTLSLRFGEALIEKLNCLYGKKESAFSSIKIAPSYYGVLHLTEPIKYQKDIEKSIAYLAKKIFIKLAQQGMGWRVIDIILLRPNGMAQTLSIQTSNSLTPLEIFLSLFKEKLASLAHILNHDDGFDAFQLRVRAHEKRHFEQLGLFAQESPHHHAQHLIEGLSIRLGPQNVKMATTADSHIPEEAATWQNSQIDMKNYQMASQLPPRPFRIFCPPQPIDVVAMVPDGAPISFRWRRVLHRIRLAQGPERISAQWWKNSAEPRNYYRVEDENGQRFWVFYQGNYSQNIRPKWFLHGLFS